MPRPRAPERSAPAPPPEPPGEESRWRRWSGWAAAATVVFGVALLALAAVIRLVWQDGAWERQLGWAGITWHRALVLWNAYLLLAAVANLAYERCRRAASAVLPVAALLSVVLVGELAEAPRCPNLLVWLAGLGLGLGFVKLLGLHHFARPAGPRAGHGVANDSGRGPVPVVVHLDRIATGEELPRVVLETLLRQPALRRGGRWLAIPLRISLALAVTEVRVKLATPVGEGEAEVRLAPQHWQDALERRLVGTGRGIELVFTESGPVRPDVAQAARALERTCRGLPGVTVRLPKRRWPWPPAS